MELNISNKRAQIISTDGDILLDILSNDISLTSQTEMIIRVLNSLLAPKCIKYKNNDLKIKTSNKLLLSLDKSSTVTESYKPHIHVITKHMQLLPFNSIIIIPIDNVIYIDSETKKANSKINKNILTMEEAFKKNKER